MDASIEGTVSSALALQAAGLQQQKQMTLLRQTLDIQSTTVTEILQSMPQLATEGSVGRNVNTFA